MSDSSVVLSSQDVKIMKEQEVYRFLSLSEMKKEDKVPTNQMLEGLFDELKAINKVQSVSDESHAPYSPLNQPNKTF